MLDNFGARIAERALDLVGVPFRLHGRTAEAGLDCIGLVAATLQSVGFNLPVPKDYQIRGQFDGRAAQFFNAACFEALAPDQDSSSGDLYMVRVAPRQLHFIIAVAGGFVHAHAGLRRVVLTPGSVIWPIIGRWRYIGG